MKSTLELYIQARRKSNDSIEKLIFRHLAQRTISFRDLSMDVHDCPRTTEQENYYHQHISTWEHQNKSNGKFTVIK